MIIKQLTKLINNIQLDETTNFLSNATANTNISIDDLAISPLIASNIGRPFVYVTTSGEGVDEATAIFKNLGFNVVSCNVEPDMPLYTDARQSNNELYDAVNAFKGGRADILVLNSSTLLACVPTIESEKLNFQINEKMDIRKTVSTIEDFGYVRVGRVTREGDFSQKGDVVDIWLLDAGSPIRIMFFGDTVEAVKKIDSDDFSTIESIKDIQIKPITSFTNISPELVRKKLESIKPAHENTKSIIKSLQVRLDKNGNIGDVKWLTPFLFSQASILSSIRNTTSIVVFERPREILESLKNHEQQNHARLASLIDGGLLLDEHQSMFSNVSTLIKELEDIICIGFGGKDKLFKTENIFSIKTLLTANYFSALGVLTPDIIRNVETHKKTVIVFVGNSKSLENYLSSKGVHFHVSNLSDIKQNAINIIYQTLGVSFEIAGSNLVVYSITTPSKATKNETPRKVSGDFVMPNIGEVVVHEFHGLGRYLGIKNLRLGSEDKDYMVLQYDGGAFVYVPLEQVGILSNYHGEPSRLNRIGGKDFADAKQRVRRRLKELSFKLGELYVKRAKVRPNIYDCDEQTMEEFFNAFHFQYTIDQLKAIDDIKNDMTGDKVMDRLICGDVGYGKTEVALHAAFRAIMSGYQVAMLCPTTILSVQHANTAKNRLGKFGVRVEVLNRFKTESETREILDGLKSGAVDMVIGTHRLLSGDVRYKNLSLLILDEEQRFGVSHKEKIKTIKSNIDVLTLSATPIPRTLNMALVGLRDISNITTPPINRSAIMTYVSEYSDELVLDAILRETGRRGQVLILYNNVKGIDVYANRIKRILHNAGQNLIIEIIHGQMTPTRMEDTIIRTYNKEIDVLIASTIVENGIDIATANTFIAVDADRLGVAQMHQLRGRVGRSNVQAYAYFTYQKNKEISEISTKRLDAISKFAGLGSGYNIAMRDLQIRGAGDLLGAEQSGHIDQVGFEVYMKILKEIAAEMTS